MRKINIMLITGAMALMVGVLLGVLYFTATSVGAAMTLLPLTLVFLIVGGMLVEEGQAERKALIYRQAMRARRMRELAAYVDEAKHEQVIALKVGDYTRLTQLTADECMFAAELRVLGSRTN